MNSNVGDKIQAENANWTFGGNVASEFDSHVSKSVPFYKESHDMIAQLSDFFLDNHSLCYDLGCSTGRLAKIIFDRHSAKNIKIIGYDCEENMIKKAKENYPNEPNIDFFCDDILNVDLEKSDLIICSYTVQFIRPRNRQLVIDRVFKALNWGGAFILFEKVRGADARFQDILTALYTDYKLNQGYKPEEIIGKSRSLKGILEPFSTQANIDLLQRAGFKDIYTVMKYICFEGFLAIK